VKKIVSKRLMKRKKTPNWLAYQICRDKYIFGDSAPGHGYCGDARGKLGRDTNKRENFFNPE
jgi:hypothetical protein